VIVWTRWWPVTDFSMELARKQKETPEINIQSFELVIPVYELFEILSTLNYNNLSFLWRYGPNWALASSFEVS
jgi:hypothetical protein